MASDVEKLVPDRRHSLDGQVVAPELQARISRITVELSEDLFNQCTILVTDPDLTLINGKELTGEVFMPNWTIDLMLTGTTQTEGTIDSDARMDFHNYLKNLESSEDFFDNLEQ